MVTGAHANTLHSNVKMSGRSIAASRIGDGPSFAPPLPPRGLPAARVEGRRANPHAYSQHDNCTYRAIPHAEPASHYYDDNRRPRYHGKPHDPSSVPKDCHSLLGRPPDSPCNLFWTDLKQVVARHPAGVGGFLLIKLANGVLGFSRQVGLTAEDRRPIKTVEPIVLCQAKPVDALFEPNVIICWGAGPRIGAPLGEPNFCHRLFLQPNPRPTVKASPYRTLPTLRVRRRRLR